MNRNGRGVPGPRTGDLSSPPELRLLPLRDMATLLGVGEADVKQACSHFGIAIEALSWRGVEVESLPLGLAMQLFHQLHTGGGAQEQVTQQELMSALDAERALAASAQEQADSLRERLSVQSKELEQLQARFAAADAIVQKQPDWELAQRSLQHQLEALDKENARLQQVAALAQEEQPAPRQDQNNPNPESLALQEEVTRLRDQLEGERAAAQRATDARLSTEGQLVEVQRSLQAAEKTEQNLERYANKLEAKLAALQKKKPTE